jgi:Zn-dependent peptidase ImmA (M78 family)
MPLPPETFAACVRSAQNALGKCGVKPLVAPVHIDSIAGSIGYQIVRIRSAADEFSGLLSPKHKLIGVNGNHHPHRQRFTIAHEIGHVIMGHPPERKCSSSEIEEFNRESDVCASELLMPTQLLAPLLLARKGIAAATLARLFDVSEEAMSVKIRHLREFLLAVGSRQGVEKGALPPSHRVTGKKQVVL